MADVNSKIYGKSGSTTFAIMPESIGTQIKMNDESGAASNVDAEIVTLRTKIAGLAGAMVFKGVVNAASDLPSTNYKAGWQYIVQTAGTYVGKICEVGDAILCIKDYASATASNNDWTVLQVNLDGVVVGPATSVVNQIAVFDSTSGTKIKDSGFTIAKSVPSDAQFTDTTYSDATTTDHGLMSATDKTKMNSLEALPTKTGQAGKVLMVDSAGTGLQWSDTTVPIATTSATGVVMVGNNLTINSTTGKLDATDTTYSDATTTTAGLMSTTDKAKLDGVATGAEVNQNAVSNIKIGTTTVSAADKTDTIEFVAGNGITLAGDATNKKVTVTETYFDVCVVTAEPTTPPTGLRDGGLIIYKQP